MNSEFDFDCSLMSFNIAKNSSLLSSETIFNNEKWFKVKHDLHEIKVMASVSKPAGVDKENTNSLCGSNTMQNNSSSSGALRVVRVPAVRVGAETCTSTATVTPSGGPALAATASGARKKQVNKPGVSTTKPLGVSNSAATSASAGVGPHARVSKLPMATAPSGKSVSSSCNAARPINTASGGGPVVSSLITTKSSVKRTRDATAAVISKPPTTYAASNTHASAARPRFTIASISSTSSSTSAATSLSCDDEILSMLKAHNKQTVGSSHTYEPAMHSVRDVRKWEKSTGRLWGELKTSEDRARANAEIDVMKKAAMALTREQQGL